MTEFLRASNLVAGGSATRAIDEARDAHPVQDSRWREPSRACTATALAALLLAGSSVHALATSGPPSPAKNHVWAGCVLSTTAVAELKNSVEAGANIGPPEVAFVVVYSLKNDNDGQPYTGTGGGFTGPVICTNPAVVDPPIATSQTDDIGSSGDTVNILDAEEAFLLQYQFQSAPTDIEKRVCHTVDSKTDCFLIVPVPID